MTEDKAEKELLPPKKRSSISKPSNLPNNTSERQQKI